MRFIPFPSTFFDCTVLVYPLAETQGVRGAATLTDGSPVSFSASVQQALGSTPSERTEWRAEAAAGIRRFTLYFPSDPGISSPDQRIDWTADCNGALATPLKLRSEGPADKTQTGGAAWVVLAEMA